MSNAKKIYESVFGKIPDGYEIHHILPKHAGGTDDIENLIAVSPYEHAQLHLERYEKHGDFRDLCAYYMIGYNFSEAHKISSSEGGKIGGKIVRSKQVGIFRSEEDRKIWASMGGKIGGKIQAEMGLGFHQYKNNPKLHKEWASKGGKNSGQFQNKEFQSEMGKRGGVKNKGFIWINDGSKSFKYTKKMQDEMSLEEFLKNNSNIRKGRLNA
jgi:hypothetical protein